MTKYIEWSESYGGDFPNPPELICRMSFEDIARWQRAREPRYTSDEQAIEDFLVINWGRVVEYPS